MSYNPPTYAQKLKALEVSTMALVRFGCDPRNTAKKWKAYKSATARNGWAPVKCPAK